MDEASPASSRASIASSRDAAVLLVELVADRGELAGEVVDARVRLLRLRGELLAGALEGGRERSPVADSVGGQARLDRVQPYGELFLVVALAGELLDPLGEGGERLRGLGIGRGGELRLEPSLDRVEPGGGRLVELVANGGELTGELVDAGIGLRRHRCQLFPRALERQREVLAADEPGEAALDRRDVLGQGRVRP